MQGMMRFNSISGRYGHMLRRLAVALTTACQIIVQASYLKNLQTGLVCTN